MLSPIRTLLRLAVLAAILALVVPYIKPLLFGSTTAAAHNGTVKSSYHHAEPTHTKAVGSDAGRKEEVDVFNFKHEDYLQVAKQSAGKKSAGTAGKEVVVSTPKAVASVKGSRPARPSRHNDDEEHDDDDDETSSSSTSRTRTKGKKHNNDDSTSSTLLSILRASYTLTTTLIRFLSIPFVLCGRFILHSLNWLYRTARSTVGHILRPVLIAGAPLTYLVSGIVSVFISTPLRIALAVGTELYPVYIFLGAAAVVGIAMGLAAAAVLYITAFVFVDRLPAPQPKQTAQYEREAKGRKMYETDREEYGGYEGEDVFTERKYPQQYEGYFGASIPANYSSPLISPTTPYRNTRAPERRYPAYPSAPSSLRASVA